MCDWILTVNVNRKNVLNVFFFFNFITEKYFLTISYFALQLWLTSNLTFLLKLLSFRAIQIIRDSFWTYFRPPLAPMCHWVTLSRNPPPPHVTCQISFYKKTYLSPDFLWWNLVLKWTKNGTCHFGWPPPSPMCHLVTQSWLPPPPKVSRIIWMAPSKSLPSKTD